MSEHARAAGAQPVRRRQRLGVASLGEQLYVARHRQLDAEMDRRALLAALRARTQEEHVYRWEPVDRDTSGAATAETEALEPIEVRLWIDAGRHGARWTTAAGHAATVFASPTRTVLDVEPGERHRHSWRAAAPR